MAHYQATGKKTLLTVATRLADLFDREFGPGKKDYIPGHEGIELALVKLSRATGEKRYFELAQGDARSTRPEAVDLRAAVQAARSPTAPSTSSASRCASASGTSAST